jgi:hypothetical protein
MKTLSWSYSQFTPEERLRLTLAADARGDTAEVERLMRSCPQMPGTVPDPEYTVRFVGMLSAVRAVLIQWLEASAYVLYFQLTWESFTAEDDARVATAETLWKKWSAIWRGIEMGITKFCAEADLPVDQLFTLAEGRPVALELARGHLHGEARADGKYAQGIQRRLWEASQLGKEP